MPPNVIGIEVTTLGGWAMSGVARYASNRILVAASANADSLLTQAGYLYAQLIVRSSQNTDIHCFVTLIAGMVWNLNHPSWDGRLLLSDDMILIASAAGVGVDVVRFNLEFLDRDEGF